jgi:Family of unknown function (DUF5675)
MELELIRKYFPLGTTGQIFHQCRLITHSIELPWKDNHAQVSCIPEGRYRIIKRYTEHFGQHFAVMGVPGRKDILIHPANDALLELRGCIAPVSMLTGEAEAKGLKSREALQDLVVLTNKAFRMDEPVFLIIKTIL